jgi:predicted acylesterase/phospholipase RssA
MDGMVLSGGGARGAYEFGALEVLAPVLDAPVRIIVDTSAGGLGAAYLAANAHAGLEAAAQLSEPACAARLMFPGPEIRIASRPTPGKS